MKNRLHGKKAGIAILAALIIVSLAEPYWVKYEYSASQQNKPMKNN